MRVSIVVPTRNRPVWLRRALKSLAMEGAPRDQVEVVVTDNSDNVESGRLVTAEFGELKVLYFRNEPPTGMVENWNLGAARARGEWVIFLHDDDYFLPGWWGHAAEAVREKGRGAVAHAFSVQPVDSRGRCLSRGGKHQERYLAAREAIRELLTHSSLIRFPGMMLHRDWLMKVGGFDPHFEEVADLEMWLKAAAQGGIHFHRTILSAYTLHEEAATEKMFTEVTLQRVFKLGERCAAEGLIEPEVLQEARARFFWRFILAGAWRAWRRGNVEEKARILALAELPMMQGISCPWRFRLFDVMLRCC